MCFRFAGDGHRGHVGSSLAVVYKFINNIKKSTEGSETTLMMPGRSLVSL